MATSFFRLRDMRTHVKALITALVVEALALACLLLGLRNAEWSEHKTKAPDHLLIDFAMCLHAPGFIAEEIVLSDWTPREPWEKRRKPPETFAEWKSEAWPRWTIAAFVTLPFWFLFWDIVYGGVAGVRERIGKRRHAQSAVDRA